jgi:hypothetical protein
MCVKASSDLPEGSCARLLAAYSSSLGADLRITALGKRRRLGAWARTSALPHPADHQPLEINHRLSATSGHQLTRPRARPAGARFSRQRRGTMPKPAYLQTPWKLESGIRDRLLREPSRNRDPGVQTRENPGKSTTRPSAKRPVIAKAAIREENGRSARNRFVVLGSVDPQRTLKEWLPS